MVRLTCAEARNKFEKKIKKRRSTEALRLYYTLLLSSSNRKSFSVGSIFFRLNSSGVYVLHKNLTLKLKAQRYEQNSIKSQLNAVYQNYGQMFTLFIYLLVHLFFFAIALSLFA